MHVTAPFEPAIVCLDLPAMLGFYRDVLSMTVFSIDQIGPETACAARLSTSGYTIARLQTAGGDRLKLVAPRQVPAAQPSSDYVMQRHGFAYLTYIVPDLAATLATLRRAGTPILTGPTPIEFRPDVVQLFFAHDPEGNCLEFVQREDLADYRPTGGATR